MVSPPCVRTCNVWYSVLPLVDAVCCPLPPEWSLAATATDSDGNDHCCHTPFLFRCRQTRVIVTIVRVVAPANSYHLRPRTFRTSLSWERRWQNQAYIHVHGVRVKPEECFRLVSQKHPIALAGFLWRSLVKCHLWRRR